MVGKVFVPLPPGRSKITPEAIEAARHLGLSSMLWAAMGSWKDDPQDFWDVATLTDPFLASNMMHAASFEQRRVMFVERGAAQRLARGKDELVAVPFGKNKQMGKNWMGSVFHALNPLAALDRVCALLQSGGTKADVVEAAAAAQDAQNEEDGVEEENFQLKPVPGFSSLEKGSKQRSSLSPSIDTTTGENRFVTDYGMQLLL